MSINIRCKSDILQLTFRTALLVWLIFLLPGCNQVPPSTVNKISNNHGIVVVDNNGDPLVLEDCGKKCDGFREDATVLKRTTVLFVETARTVGSVKCCITLGIDGHGLQHCDWYPGNSCPTGTTKAN